MNKYLIDTTFLVDHLRGNSKTGQFLEKEEPYVSTVTIAELIQGARNKEELAIVKKIYKNVNEIYIDKNISKKAITFLQELNLSSGLLFLDALIAATAIENKLVLVTKNIKYFKDIPTLQVVPQETFFK